MIPVIGVIAAVLFFAGVVSQPGPIALACLVGWVGSCSALWGWWVEHVYGIRQ